MSGPSEAATSVDLSTIALVYALVAEPSGGHKLSQPTNIICNQIAKQKFFYQPWTTTLHFQTTLGRILLTTPGCGEQVLVFKYRAFLDITKLT